MIQVNLQAHEQNPTWRTDAACRGLVTDWFHPERGGDTSQPKAICATCTVTAECLAYALVNFEKHGIWGGLSERERRPLRKRLVSAGLLALPVAPIDHGTNAGYTTHRRRGEQPCRMCMEARAAYERECQRPISA